MNKTRQWAVLTAVACLAVLVAGFFLLVKPQRAHASQLRTQAAGLQQDNNRLRAHVNQLRQEQKDIPAEQKQLAQIATKIPDNPALPALIRQLSAAADGAGVSLVSLAPGQPTALAAPGAKTVTTTAAPPTTPLSSISVAINVQGSYFNVEQFFSAVESLNRAMLVNGFTMAPLASGASTTTSSSPLPPNTLNAQITATVFEAPQLAAAAAQPATTTTVH